MVDVVVARTLPQALEYMKNAKAIPFAGGTDLMVKYRNWSGLKPKFPGPVIMIGELDELKGISLTDGAIVIGAAETLADIAVNKNTPEILRTAIRQMASPAIRNMGTIGGNICNASPAGDTLPPLYALGAAVEIKSSGGVRILPLAQLIKGPGRIDLAEDELVTAVRIPAHEFNRSFYRKVGTRNAQALAKLSIACLASIKDNSISQIRIAAGAVAPTVVCCAEAEKILEGQRNGRTDEFIESIMAIYAEQIKPIDDQRSTANYRKSIAMSLIRHFIMEIGAEV